MKEEQVEHLSNRLEYDEFSYKNIKYKFLEKFRTEEYIDRNYNTAKIGYTLFDYVLLDDSTFNYLVQLRFGVQ
jgi:hypothetical protein